MNALSAVLFARELPERLRLAEKALFDILHLGYDIRHLVAASMKPRVAPVEPTYLYVLAHERPMLAKRVSIAPGVTDQVCFDAILPLPAGAWITVVGPAVIRGVRVGNQMQQAMSDPSGHVCTTVDALLVGQRLVVELFVP